MRRRWCSQDNDIFDRLMWRALITVRDAGNAFDDKDNLKDERSAKQLKLIAQRLVEYAQQVV